MVHATNRRRSRDRSGPQDATGLLAFPASAFAAKPEAATAGAIALSPTSELVGGVVSPQGEAPSYFAEYATASSEWCKSGGKTGSAEKTEAAQISSTGASAYFVTVEINGLETGVEYCVEVVAKNATGRSKRSGSVKFAAGAPYAEISQTQSAGETSESIAAEVAGAGQATEYAVQYGLSTSEWCSSKGLSGAPEHTTAPRTEPAEAEGQLLEFELTGLTPGASYCAAVHAKNASASTTSAQATFTAAAPLAQVEAATALSPTAVDITGYVDPEGQATHYRVEYASAQDRWCTTGGREGTATASAEAELGVRDANWHEVTVELSGLTRARPTARRSSPATRAAPRRVAHPVSLNSRPARRPSAWDPLKAPVRPAPFSPVR